MPNSNYDPRKDPTLKSENTSGGQRNWRTSNAQKSAERLRHAKADASNRTGRVTGHKHTDKQKYK